MTSAESDARAFSRTDLGVAAHRVIHQLLAGDPKILDDPDVQAGHPPSRLTQRAHQGLAQVPGAASHENAHGCLARPSWGPSGLAGASAQAVGIDRSSAGWSG